MADMEPSVIQHSDLLGRLVIDRNTTDDLGRVDQVWLAHKTHQIVGLSCKSGLLGRKHTEFSWGQIETIGDESVLVSYVAGTETQRPPDTELIIGHEVWTDGGNRAGTVVDYRFNVATGAVVDYLFVSNGWRGRMDGVYRLSPTAVISVGSKRMIVNKTAVEEPEQVSAGLADRVTKMTEFLKDDLSRTKDDMKAALEGTQAIASQVQSQGQKLADQAQEKVADLGDRLPGRHLSVADPQSSPEVSGTEEPPADSLADAPAETDPKV
ncbi:MAG: photosystem reaction center subunit H [Leptolyngbya sp. DLM2.Bin15]|nr:MAG: photosystem reaction center subunit H [Leptolyngbya sp. DLM2.Bin15]